MWKLKNMTRKNVIRIIGIIGIIFSLAFFVYLKNPLFKDEDGIKYFEKNKLDLLELVRMFREYDSHPHSEWAGDKKAHDILKKLSILYMNEDGLRVWLPNPYSKEMAKEYEGKSSKDKFKIIYKYVGVAIRLGEPLYYTKFSWRERSWIWKEFVYFPNSPKIVNGYLMSPVNKNGKTIRLAKIVQGLDDYPDNWKRGECFLRKLEDQWFMRMCRAD